MSVDIILMSIHSFKAFCLFQDDLDIFLQLVHVLLTFFCKSSDLQNRKTRLNFTDLCIVTCVEMNIYLVHKVRFVFFFSTEIQSME